MRRIRHGRYLLSYSSLLLLRDRVPREEKKQKTKTKVFLLFFLSFLENGFLTAAPIRRRRAPAVDPWSAGAIQPLLLPHRHRFGWEETIRLQAGGVPLLLLRPAIARGRGPPAAPLQLLRLQREDGARWGDNTLPPPPPFLWDPVTSVKSHTTALLFSSSSSSTGLEFLVLGLSGHTHHLN